MFGPGSIAMWLGQFLGGPLTAITGQIADIFKTKTTSQQAEFIAMTAADRDATLALLQAQTNANNAKITNNAHGAAYFMVWFFGFPAAFHWSAVFIFNTPPFSFLHWQKWVVAVPQLYQDAELKIAMSFFILAPALPILAGLQTRLSGR